MTAQGKRLPGQSNDDYEKRDDPNTQFLGTQSLYGGGDPTFVLRAMHAFFRWLDRRRGRRTTR